MKNIAAVAVAALGITAGAVGWAHAGPSDGGAPTPTTTVAGAASPRPDGVRPMAVLRRTVHGDLIVRQQDGFENVTYDRGMVTAVSADSLTLHRPDGVDVTVKLTDQTRYAGVADAGAVQKDKPAMVLSKDGIARLVAQRDPNAPAPQGGRRGPGARRPGAPGAPGATTTTTAAA